MGQPVFDGNESFLGGQNAGLEPHLIGQNQYWKGINTSNKNGALRSRPGYKHLVNVTVITEGGIVGADARTRSYKDIFRTGKLQGAGPYIADQGVFIIVIISGIIFRIDSTTNMAVVLEVEEQDSLLPFDAEEPPTQRLNQYTDKHHWSQAGKYFVIFDYPDYPVIIEGQTARRVDPAKYEIPVPAVLGTYNQNRLFVFSNVHEFTAGDPVGNPATPDAPITFEEVFAPAAAFNGQVFSLGSTNINNPITAVGFLPAVDGNTAIGPLFVATKSTLYGYHTELERAQWGQAGFGSLLLNKAGIAGQRAFVSVQSDLWFMGGDGRIRSFSVARGDQQKWSRTPLDKEVNTWIRFPDKSLVQYTLAAYHNNRIIFSVNPYFTTAKDLAGKNVSDIAFKGMVVLELDSVSGFMQAANPAWAGLWTGINPTEFVELEDELYIFSKDPGSINVLYKMEPDDITWDTWQGKKKQIVSRVELRDYTFSQQGLMHVLKEEVTVYPGLKEVGGKFCLAIDRKNDDYPNYTPWRTFKHDAPIETCDAGCVCTLPVLIAHSFREINFGDPQNIDDVEFCNPVTNEQMRYFNHTQFRLTLTGLTWSMTAFRVKAELQEDDQNITEQVCGSESVQNIKICDVSDFDLYSTALKQGGWSCHKIEC